VTSRPARRRAPRRPAAHRSSVRRDFAATRGRPLAALDVARLVLSSELLRLVRDRRAIFTAVVLPVVLYPLIFAGNSWLQQVSRETMAARRVVVGLDLEGAPPELAAALRRALAGEIPIELVDVDAERVRTVAAGVQAGVASAVDGDVAAARDLLAVIPHHALAQRIVFRVHYKGSDDLSNEARRRVRKVLGELERSESEELRARVLGNQDPGRGLDAEVVDVATSQATSGAALGRLLPLLSVLVVLSGGAFGALSTYAGERESQTLETLLVQPVPTQPLAWGKFAAVLLLALAALVSNAGSLVLSVTLGLGSLPGVEHSSGSLAPEIGRLALGAVAFLPAVVLLCALLCLVSARARSFREGQHAILPLTLVAALPAAAAGWGDVQFDVVTALVPLFGQGLALRDALLGRLELLPGTVSFAAGCAWSYLALTRITRLLDAERVLSTEADEREAELRGTQSRAALAWGFAAVLLIYVVGGRLQSWRPLAGLLLTLWLLAPLLALTAARGMARRAGVPVSQLLSLRAPRPAHVIGALLAAPGFAALMRLWVPLQQRVLPMPSGQLSDAGPLADLLAQPLGVLLFAMALSPAVGEELLFRGAIQGGLARDLPPRKVALWQALLFGLAHASVYRFLPTAVLGAGLSLLVARSASLIPAIVLHLGYNALLVAGERVPALADPRLGWLALIGVGLLLLPSGRSSSPRRGMADQPRDDRGG
jgi:sodium transport system permease protein